MGIPQILESNWNPRDPMRIPKIRSESRESLEYEISRFSLAMEPKTLIPNTGWPKSHFTEKKLNISVTTRANGLIFLPIIKACSYFISIKIRLKRTFLMYHYRLQQKNVTLQCTMNKSQFIKIKCK